MAMHKGQKPAQQVLQDGCVNTTVRQRCALVELNNKLTAQDVTQEGGLFYRGNVLFLNTSAGSFDATLGGGVPQPYRFINPTGGQG